MSNGGSQSKISSLVPLIAALIGLAAAVLSSDVWGPPMCQALGLCASPRADSVAVQDVYDLPVETGVDVIRGQGFTHVRTISVCSRSVGQGRIREVLLDNDAPVEDETSLVNRSGSTGINVPLTARLLVKVSNGQSC